MLTPDVPPETFIFVSGAPGPMGSLEVSEWNFHFAIHGPAYWTGAEAAYDIARPTAVFPPFSAA